MKASVAKQKLDIATVSIRRKIRTLISIQPRLKFYYWYYCKYCKVKQNRMLFESFHGKGISDSSYAVLQHMINTGQVSDYEIYYASDNLERDRLLVDKNNLPIKLVDIGTREYVYILATAKYLLNNSSFPLYFIRRDEQVYVQTWHGTPLKTLGKEMRLGMESMVNVQHNFLQANWLTFPNDFTRDVIMRDYNLDQLYCGKVAMVGYPRNTVFLAGGDADIRTRYDLEGYTTFAYMPTWRGKSNHDVEISIYADVVSSMLRELDARLSDSQKMFVNFHSMVAASITLDSYKHIFPFPKDVGTYDFLAQIDVLVTDYSSVMFDFALTRRPVVLFTYDEEQYLADRGMYFPLSELPFLQVKTVDELGDCLANQTYAISENDLEEFGQKYLSYDSRNNSQNVLDLLLGNVPSDVRIIDYGHNKDKVWTLVDVEPQKTIADLNGIFLDSDSDDLLVLNRASFGPGKSSHVYDNYLDRTFIFRTKTTPRTFVEDVTKRFWPPTAKRLEMRERKRLVGDLNTAPEIRSSVLSGYAWTSYSPDRDVTIKGFFESNGSSIEISFDAGELVARKVMLITNMTMTMINQIRWSRDLTEEEARDSRVVLDVERPVCNSIYTRAKSNRMRVCLMLEDVRTHDTFVGNIALGINAKEEHMRFGRPIFLDHDNVARLLGRDEHGRTGWRLLDKAGERSICCVPYQNETGFLSLVYTYEEQVGRMFYRVTATSIRAPKQRRFILHFDIDGGTPEVKAVRLCNRLVASETAYDLDFTVRRRRHGLAVKATFDPAGKLYDGIFWDLHIMLGSENGDTYDIMVDAGALMRHSFYFRNVQCVLGDGNILFPYSTIHSKLAFSHRPMDESDTLVTKAKEWAAIGAYVLLLPYWRRKKTWLVYEKFCSLAQDNGFAFFEYCMQREGSEQDRRILYVMNRSSAEYSKVAPYGRKIVDFMSFRHMLYALVANIYVGSDAKSHLYQWRPKPSVIRNMIMRKNVFFLQHGVTALKRVDYLFGKKGSSPMTYFLTTSHAEQDVVTQNFEYNIAHAPVLGFSRWDLLEDTSDKSHPTILMMPTWRQWLEDVDEDTFLDSEYYKAYSDLIHSKEMVELLERSNATLKFFIHPKFSEQLRHFHNDSSRVELIDMGSQPLNKLIMECSLLITDYSSVCWDVLYMDKPVVFYQFDQDRYENEVGSYIDLNADLPGDVCFTQDEVLDALESVVDSGFNLGDEAREVAKQWFDFKDKNNRKRTYEFLISEGR